MLDVVWLSRVYRSLPCSHNCGKVIRVNRVGGGPSLQFLEGLAEVLQNSAVGEFELPSRCRESDEGRQAIDDHAKPIVARAEPALSRESIGDSGELVLHFSLSLRGAVTRGCAPSQASDHDTFVSAGARRQHHFYRQGIGN
jgi:hypothetical protein